MNRVGRPLGGIGSKSTEGVLGKCHIRPQTYIDRKRKTAAGRPIYIARRKKSAGSTSRRIGKYSRKSWIKETGIGKAANWSPDFL
jgi:hypothetical protein